ncbi:MAG TPA: STAS domain-containing protein [Terracidiphilus sp.]|jgi:anti-anti-sigma factor|nr:STAS domain-containing protein [Terracidiphilus sp.]
MNDILSHIDDTLLISPGDLHELVRGQEQDLVTRLTPIVRRQSVTLDLTHVERIDAAGIAALISLYGCASAAGNNFSVVNASTRVAEILALVGLDRILISHNAVPCPQSEPCFAQPAA